ncbi:calcium-binding protein [Pseudoprimorskyibacter insulae]|uniref:Leukotoxin n=1 Tax=Pseudoprimorskyibacter insulae TaxID=1695997 RepID=A0A2R8AVF0_9RHOB|nr:calcium-binding protein [Pseudoprimorskyibacter insulae]SPF80001.1 Leukotoxin [Pseudoprimorskyibacter insulae]
MLWLAGLMGIMVLGSVAVVTTGLPEDDIDLPDDPAQDEDLGTMPLPDPVSDPNDFELPSIFRAQSANAPTGMKLLGTGDSDTLGGELGTDLINGMGGDDFLSGDGGDDQIWGGAGDDIVMGGDQNDTLHGESGGDAIAGGAGQDDLYGHDGDDTLTGDDGDDALYGGLGADILNGGAGADALLGREGDDTLIGGTGHDTLQGGAGNDALIGFDDDETDYLNGADGDDLLIAGLGDVLSGGDGSDTFLLGDWLRTDAAALTDFSPQDDRMVVVYDDLDMPSAPEVSIGPSTDDPDTVEIRLNGDVVGTVPAKDAPMLHDIIVMAESEANMLNVV